MQGLAGLEMRDALGANSDGITCSRVAARATIASPRGERSEAAQFNPPALGKAVCDRLEQT